MIFNVQIDSPELFPQKDLLPQSLAAGLKHGRIISAKVMSLGPGNRSQLMISGQQISVKTTLPLTPGTTLSLMVNREDTGQVSLHLTPDALLTQAGSGAGGVNALGSLFQGLEEIFPRLGKTGNQGIHDVLQALSLRSGIRNEEFLPNLIENMGLSLEKKLAAFVGGSTRKAFQAFWEATEKQDLKAAVLSVIQTAGDDGEPALMKGVANTLDGFQQLNQQGADSHRYLLPFPMLTGEYFDFGLLLINTGRDGRNDDETRVIQIAFLMKMSALGNIRADFSILDNAITGRFLLEDRDTRDYLESLMPDLYDRLESIQYKARRIECRVGTPKDLSSDVFVQSMVAPIENAGFNVVI